MTPRFDEPPDLQALTRLVRDCAVSEVGRNVLLLRTDLLLGSLFRPHHRRLATEALEPLSLLDRARFFRLKHDRVAVAWRGDGAARLRATTEQLEHLLLDGPAGTPTLPDLVRVFTLPDEGAALLALAASPSFAEARIADAAPPLPPATPLPPLTAEMVEGMMAPIARGNVAPFARQRTVFHDGAGGFTRAWDARSLSLRALVAELAPGHDPFAEPAFVHRLAAVADRRLLALMATGAELRDTGPFSLLLRVESALSAEFLRLDAALPTALRGRATVAFRPADVLADLAAFRFACSFLRARGFRVSLRGVTPALLDLLDVAALAPDVVELRWSPATLRLDATRLPLGRARPVLSNADDPAALAWGRAAGIRLFQGRAVAAAGAVAGQVLVGAAA